MTSYFRLLAGLTSLISVLCFCHLPASGPEGILESSLAMTGKGSALNCARCGRGSSRQLLRGVGAGRGLGKTGENRTRDGEIAEEIEHTVNHRHSAQRAGPFG